MSLKKILAVLIALIMLAVAAGAAMLIRISSELPQLITVEDYEPLLVSEVFDRNGQKIGEFFREKRILTPFEEIPEVVIQAFISAEDASFFEHRGINLRAIFRAFMANLKAGRKVQGGSTITQQVARSLLLSSEKTYDRKLREVMLALRMERTLSKQDIMYLYLNQIFLGQTAYGVAAATQIYFRKPLAEIELAEAALLAGLPQAPSRYSPIHNPSRAKARQRYVLGRMAEEGFISAELAAETINSPLNIFVRKDYRELAPYYLETIRTLLVRELGEVTVLDRGIRIYTGLDLEKQLEAQEQVRQGLRQVDKRQGYRGPLRNIQEPEEVAEFLLASRNSLMHEHTPIRVIQPDGTIEETGPLNLNPEDEEGNLRPSIPPYVSAGQIVEGVVTRVDDNWGLVHVRFAESRGLIDFDSMKWARSPNPDVRFDFDEISRPSQALSQGDVILVRVVSPRFRSSRIAERLAELQQAQRDKYERPEGLPEFEGFALLELEQEPEVEGSLISFDQNTGDLIAMVGGYDFGRSEFNRSLQAARQTGSSFKALVYAAALDRGYTAATPILDAPLVYEEEDPDAEGQDDEAAVRRWRPTNHSRRFTGDILFRNALIRSLNIPTVRIIEDIGVPWVVDYSRRLGIFSPLNRDFTLALGSSGVTIYEMTRAFAQFGRLGKQLKPTLIHRVEALGGEILMERVSIDHRFQRELEPIEEEFEERRLAYLEELEEQARQEQEARLRSFEEGLNEEATRKIASGRQRQVPPLFFSDPQQLLRPTTAYILTSILRASVDEPGGTGGRARALGRPVAGKTGSTNGYFDAWFIGYSPDVATGVWVGYDNERSLGRGEVGGRAALPIWVEFMKKAHEGLPVRDFPTPEGIVFANIDNASGQLASATSEQVVQQAFVEGTEPSTVSTDSRLQEDQDFYKEDLFE